MSRPPLDSVREKRIDLQIVVDSYTPEERALGWYYYAADNLSFPFRAVRVSDSRSPNVSEGEPVEVVGMPTEEECEEELYVDIAWEGDVFAVPLIQIFAPDADSQTQQVIEDWHYWVNRGYEFG